jgi:hypothetical protein
MDRRERTDDPVEATRTAMDGKQAEMWTALPGIVQSFDPVAMTVVVQPAVQGSIQDEQGKTQNVDLPLLGDVPVVFPCGGGFTLTHPIKGGDECLIVFTSRCLDGWWDSGESSAPPDTRMHDLSDGIAIVGPRSQAGKLDPPVDPKNVQLRTDDGKAHITMMPDYTIKAENPTAKVTMSPDGKIAAEADAEVRLSAPVIILEGNTITMGGLGGGSAAATLKGDIAQDGSHTSTGDQVAGGVSQVNHPHKDAGGSGPSGPPIPG